MPRSWRAKRSIRFATCSKRWLGFAVLDERCDGPVSMRHSRAYLHHLFRAREPVVHGLLTLHNIKFMNDMMRELREAIWRDEV